MYNEFTILHYLNVQIELCHTTTIQNKRINK